MTSLPKTRRISDELGDSSGSSSYHSTHSTQAWNSRLPDVTPAFPLRQKVLEHSSLDSTTSPPTSPGSSSRGRSSRRVSGTMGAPVLGGNSDLRSDAVTRLAGTSGSSITTTACLPLSRLGSESSRLDLTASSTRTELSAGATCEDDELASLSVSRNPSQLSRNNSAYSVLRNPSQLSRNDSSPAMSRNSSRSNQRSDNDELQFSDIDEIQLESSPGVTRNSSKSQRHNSFNSFDSRTVLATAAANTSHMRTTPSREYVGLYGVGVKSGGGGGDPSPAVSRKSSAATASSVASYLSQRNLERALHSAAQELTDGDVQKTLAAINTTRGAWEERVPGLRRPSGDCDLGRGGSPGSLDGRSRTHSFDFFADGSMEDNLPGLRTPTGVCANFKSGVTPTHASTQHMQHWRAAVYDSRGTSLAARVPGEDTSPSRHRAEQGSERRLPPDGGPDLPRATMPVPQIALACDHLMVFKGLHREDRLALYSHMYEVTYRPGEQIIRAGELGRNFYLVVEGAPSRLPPKSPTKAHMQGFRKPESFEEHSAVHAPALSMTRGDSFGEVALLHSLPAKATVMATDTEVKCLALDCVTFRQLLSTAAVERRTKLVRLLAKVPLLESLQQAELVQLADALETRTYPPGRVIILQDNAATARFHIIESGDVSVRLLHSTREVKQLHTADFFGEVTLMNDNVAQPPTATVMAITETHTLSLCGGEFRRLLGDAGVQSILAANVTSYLYDRKNSGDSFTSSNGRHPIGRLSAQVRKSVGSAASASASSISGLFQKGMRKLSTVFTSAPQPKVDKLRGPAALVVDGLSRENVHFLKELGHGMTSVVYLCRLPTLDDRLVVIKMMKKTKLIRLNQVKNIIREKELVTRFECPYVVSAIGRFQDDHYLYLLMDHLEGGELFKLLVKMNRVSVSTARLYAAEILIALQYIHASGHVYRDLKPENVLLTADGHLVLTDMGFCKPLRDGEKTFTTCGTADYMAPEVMLCKGHNTMADYWSLGVFIYEMLAGYAPFESRNESERYYKILNAKLKFPPDFDPSAAVLIKQLCVVEPSKRLGCSVEGVNEIRRQPFFEGIDWAALDNYSVAATRAPGPHLMPQRSAAYMKNLKPMVFREPAPAKSDTLREVNKVFAQW